MNNRKEKKLNIIKKLENNIDFLYITDIEELLQNDLILII